ncbi:hypothetical protein [Williamsia sp. 1135]|uniref:hypothetical protein n=1 Tax=Williamsia sp. 1135 TaxID=1889262 RepID=UPI000A10786D|nr:hypothetical protein [Williamsia sp. 1135]ORM37159.1 hypothetical protein BFL43_05065 [Williamsia sp. 1135]
MVDSDENIVPVWTLATQDVTVPTLMADLSMTPERLNELRTVLAAMADSPVATLEAHPLPLKVDRSLGIHLDSASPLATHLTQLIGQTSKAGSTAAAGVGGEALYKMVVPAKVAAKFGAGMVNPMASKAAAGGVHSALMGPSGVVAQATFVPVAGQAAAAGAAGGSAATAGVAVAGAGALTVAAPLVFMAVAVGVSAHADHKRQQALEKITVLLERLHDDALQRERSVLNGCRDAIDKATGILLDQGRVGVSIGLDSAVHAISIGLADAEARLKNWEKGLAGLQNGRAELNPLRKAFSGIDEEGGEFRAHLELAELAIALKRRVIVLQAVEHAQADPGNPFNNFVRSLASDQKRVNELESRIAAVLTGLSQLKLDRSHGVRDFMFTAGDVDALLRASFLLRDLEPAVTAASLQPDVAIEMVRELDGSVVVFPALAA